jgi:hypothetical protein
LPLDCLVPFAFHILERSGSIGGIRLPLKIEISSRTCFHMRPFIFKCVQFCELSKYSSRCFDNLTVPARAFGSASRKDSRCQVPAKLSPGPPEP